MYISKHEASQFHLIEVPEELTGKIAYGVILRKDKHISPSFRDLLKLLDVSDIDP